MKWLTLPFAVILAALFVEGPMTYGAYLLAHGEPPPKDPVFRWAPAIGISMVTLLGSALVARSISLPETPTVIRAVLGMGWLTSFVSVLWVLPIYLLGAQEGLVKSRAIIALVVTSEGINPEGFLSWTWCVGIVLIIHVTVPCVMIVDALAHRVALEKAEDKAAKTTATTAEESLKGIKGNWKKRTLQQVQEEGPQTIKQIVAAIGSTESTIGKWAKELESDGLFASSGAIPNVYRLAPVQQAFS